MINLNLLKKSIFSKLSTDSTLTHLLGGIKIFHQYPPREVSYPMVVYEIIFNNDNIYDENTDSGVITETFFRITIFSSDVKSEQSDNIEQRIKTLLHGPRSLNNTDIICYSCYRESLEQRYDTEAKIWTTYTRYRLVSAPKA
jgi:hypothetical protein